MRINHDPRRGVSNLITMHRAIGTEHVQINMIRIDSDTQSQEKSEKPEIEELLQLDNEQKELESRRI